MHTLTFGKEKVPNIFAPGTYVFETPVNPGILFHSVVRLMEESSALPSIIDVLNVDNHSIMDNFDTFVKCFYYPEGGIQSYLKSATKPNEISKFSVTHKPIGLRAITGQMSIDDIANVLKVPESIFSSRYEEVPLKKKSEGGSLILSYVGLYDEPILEKKALTHGEFDMSLRYDKGTFNFTLSTKNQPRSFITEFVRALDTQLGIDKTEPFKALEYFKQIP